MSSNGCIRTKCCKIIVAFSEIQLNHQFWLFVHRMPFADYHETLIFYYLYIFYVVIFVNAYSFSMVAITSYFICVSNYVCTICSYIGSIFDDIDRLLMKSRKQNFDGFEEKLNRVIEIHADLYGFVRETFHKMHEFQSPIFCQNRWWTTEGLQRADIFSTVCEHDILRRINLSDWKSNKIICHDSWELISNQLNVTEYKRHKHSFHSKHRRFNRRNAMVVCVLLLFNPNDNTHWSNKTNDLSCAMVQLSTSITKENYSSLDENTEVCEIHWLSINHSNFGNLSKGKTTFTWASI